MSEFNWQVADMISHYTGALSMFGSVWIIWTLLISGNRKKNLRKSSSRFILAISIYDFFSSFWYFMGVWAHPKQDTVFFVGESKKNYGTVGSCEASGFFIQLGTTAIPLYNMALAVQYYLAIRWSWREDRLWESFERYAHATIIPLSLVLAIIPLPLDLYNPYYFYCWITPASYNEETGDFERGSRFSTDWFYGIFFFLVFSTALIVSGIMIAIILVVHRTVKKSSLYDFESGQAPTASMAFEGESSKEGDLQRELPRSTSLRTKAIKRAKKDIRLKQVATMAWLYTVPYYLTWIIPACIMLKNFLAWRGFVVFGRRLRLTFAAQVYVSLALPLQGFMNWFIFMYPRIRLFVMRHCCSFFRGNSELGGSSNSGDAETSGSIQRKSSQRASGQGSGDSEIVFDSDDDSEEDFDGEDDSEHDPASDHPGQDPTAVRLATAEEKCSGTSTHSSDEEQANL